jgi:hypothetical protein
MDAVNTLERVGMVSSAHILIGDTTSAVGLDNLCESAHPGWIHRPLEPHAPTTCEYSRAHLAAGLACGDRER